MSLVFKLVCLLKNLDSAIDMGDGKRSVRSALYELPIFNSTHKVKYVIGCIHLTSLSREILTEEQKQRLIYNRSVNIQGGWNNNVALDEFLEMLNRDSKVVVKGNQNKDSIILHSKKYPHLINVVNHFDLISEISARKGFHKKPSYVIDVHKVLKELLRMQAFLHIPGRQFVCRSLCKDRDPFLNSYKGLSLLIHRHRPVSPYGRLRNDIY